MKQLLQHEVCLQSPSPFLLPSCLPCLFLFPSPLSSHPLSLLPSSIVTVGSSVFGSHFSIQLAVRRCHLSSSPPCLIASKLITPQSVKQCCQNFSARRCSLYLMQYPLAKWRPFIKCRRSMWAANTTIDQLLERSHCRHWIMEKVFKKPYFMALGCHLCGFDCVSVLSGLTLPAGLLKWCPCKACRSYLVVSISPCD